MEPPAPKKRYVLPPPRNLDPPGNIYSSRGFKICLVVFAAVCVVVIILDTKQVSSRVTSPMALRPESLSMVDLIIDIQTATRRCADDSGRCTVAQPAGWTRNTTPDATNAYDLVLDGPVAMQLRVLGTPAEHDSLHILKSRLLKFEYDFNVNSGITATTFQGREAFQRTMRLSRDRLRAIDFLDGTTAWHLLISAPHKRFDEIEPALMEMLNTFALTAAAAPESGPSP